MTERAGNDDHEHNPDQDPKAAIACAQAARLYCEGRDRPLSFGEQQSLNAHIATCAACQVASRQLHRVFDQLQRLVGGEAGSS